MALEKETKHMALEVTLRSKRNKHFQIAAVTLLFAWQFFTFVGGYFLNVHAGETLKAFVILVQTGERLRETSGDVRYDSLDHDLPKLDSTGTSDLLARFEQQNSDLEVVTRKGLRLGAALVIGWVMLSLISGYVAFRLVKIANSGAEK